MDELFETLTLIQTRKLNKKMPIILYGKEFWGNLINFEQFIEWGVISPEDINLFTIVDDIENAFSIITKNIDSSIE
jgi:predicted Rossmann-fold nucleotide-binding protein